MRDFVGSVGHTRLVCADVTLDWNPVSKTLDSSREDFSTDVPFLRNYSEKEEISERKLRLQSELTKVVPWAPELSL